MPNVNPSMPCEEGHTPKVVRVLRARRPILDRILHCHFLSKVEIGVYIGVCHHVGKYGYANVSQQRLADDLGITRRRVRAALVNLTHLGVVRQIPGQGRNYIYFPISK